jgi:hypothetical protein
MVFCGCVCDLLAVPEQCSSKCSGCVCDLLVYEQCV